MKPSYYRKHYRSKLSSGKLFALAGAVFALAIGVSATSTFAWYAMTEQFRLGGFELEVNTDLSFQIGRKVDGEITYSDEGYTLSDFGYEKPTLDNISNMSCTGYPENYSETFNPTFSSGYVGPVAGLTKEAEEGFVQIELYCLANHDAFLYLSDNTCALPNEEANLDAAKKKGVDPSVLNNVTNAARMSFYSPLGYVITELGEHEDVDYCGLLDLYGHGYYITDEDDREFLYGVYDGTPRYASTPLAEDVYDYPGKEQDIFHAKHKAGSYLLDDTSFSPKKEEAHPIGSYYVPDGYHDSLPVAAIKANTPTRLVISIFLEGWDHDMTSALIDASFGIEVGFVAYFSKEAKDFFADK